VNIKHSKTQLQKPDHNSQWGAFRKRAYRGQHA